MDYNSALISYEDGNSDAAIQKFETVEQILPPNHEPNLFYAISLLKNRRIEDAINELKRLMYWPGINNINIIGRFPGEITYWPIQSVKARYWLGVAYEQQSKKEKAINEYKKFLDIWKDADFNSPEIKDAKMRLAKLK